MIPPCATTGFDFTEIETVDHPNYREAVTICGTCSMRVECARAGLAKNVAGLTAGMLPAQRDKVRNKPLPVADFLGMFPPEVITPGLLDEAIDYETQEMHPAMTRVIEYWTHRGEIPRQILARLPRVDTNGYPLKCGYGTPRFTERTITWVRDRMRGYGTWHDSGVNHSRQVHQNDMPRASSGH